MKTRNTVLLLLVAIGLFAFVHFIERDRPGTRQVEEASRNVLNFVREEIDRVILRNEDHEIVLERDGTRWTVRKPVKDRADSVAVAELFTTAELMSRDATVEIPEKKDDKDQARLKEFGLVKPGLRIRFEGRGAPPELLIGKETAIEGRVYVRFEDRNTVFVAPDALKKLVVQPPDTWRDRSLFDVGTERPERIALRTPGGELVLEREGSDWNLAKPLRARADNARVNATLAELSAMRIAAFLPDEELGDQRGKIVLRMDGEGEGRHTVEIGQDDPARPRLVRARLSDREGAVLLPGEITRLLKLVPNDVRDRNLARFDMTIVDRITLEIAGAGRTILSRAGDAWVADPEGTRRPVANELVEAMVSVLAAGRAARLVSDVPAADDRFGFARPAIGITLSSYASENTAESTKGERPFCTLLIGKSENGEAYARLEEEPFIVAVPDPWVEQFRTAARPVLTP